ncbi:tripartite tricarboxylate transporter substrate binding protein [Bordetella sp. BOR01]|uniref:tripartite tricarboxylate transporter substrate binding protein n=1 Tax=Bordetella sp. BOR01 TaxID=2854779 RepID=UPI001C472BED|nr:tripartite tricarboxylate transporter substrate binding protein [Bordetella sp. BOR01]MBV7481452.1 tripartite tricarboxylate transporter substrate binding protein [Bordetella sp. BOR01]
MQRIAGACFSVIAFLFAAVAPALAAAADAGYPDRPIRLVIPWSVGGSTDLLGRILAERMGRDLDTTVVVENKPGATGTIGYAQVARASGDGYTLLLGTNSTFAIAPHFYHDLPYDVTTDFVAVGMIGSNQQVLCVHPGVPAGTLAELVQYAKQQPGAVTYASSGVGGSSHLAMELLMSTTGTQMLHVPYRGGAPAVQAILGGQTQAGFVDISIAEPLVRAGKLRALGTSGARRAPLLPDTPTLAEAGAAGFESLTTFGLFMPAGTPAKVVARINTALNAALQDPAVTEKLGGLGFELTGGSPAAYAVYAKTETAKWGNLIQQRHIVLP